MMNQHLGMDFSPADTLRGWDKHTRAFARKSLARTSPSIPGKRQGADHLRSGQPPKTDLRFGFNPDRAPSPTRLVSSVNTHDQAQNTVLVEDCGKLLYGKYLLHKKTLTVDGDFLCSPPFVRGPGLETPLHLQLYQCLSGFPFPEAHGKCFDCEFCHLSSAAIQCCLFSVYSLESLR